MNGQFRRCALELQRQFPGLRIEGGPYAPPIAVQYGIRAVRAAQAATGVFFFFGEQILSKLGREPFEFMGELHTSIMVHVGALYGLNVVADTLKSINAFEVVYNGQVLHSKLASGGFPEPGVVAKKLQDIIAKEKQEKVKEASTAS